MANKGVAALRQFTLGKGKSGGRNSQGRITAYHRGGGAKRLLRRIDLKRNVPGVGIVERIEYDPNRSAKIALVRWVESAATPPPEHRQGRNVAVDQDLASLREKVLGSATAAADGGRFSFASLPGKAERGRAGDVLSSALSSSSSFAKKAAKGEGGFAALPRMAVAGAKPAFYAVRVRGGDGGEEVSLGEIREWRPQRDVWAHRIKRRAAISWHSVRHHSTLEAVGAKPKVVDHGEGLSAILSLTGSSSQSSEHLFTGPKPPPC